MAANLVVEGHCNIEALVAEVGRQTAEHLGQQRALLIVAGLAIVGGGVRVLVSSDLRLLALGDVGIDPVEGLTLLVDTGIVGQHGVVERTALAVPHRQDAQRLHGLAEATVVLNLACGQLQDLRTVVRKVGGDVPVDILCADNSSREHQLDTGVADVAKVAVVATGTQALRYRQPEQQVRGLLGVEVDRTCEAALQERELHASVEVGRCLPCNVLVTHTAERRRHAAVRGVGGEIVEVGVGKGTDVVVTLLTDRCLELQLVDEGSVEPLLLADDPCSTCRPEVAPTVILGKVRRGIATIRERSEVAAVVVILCAAEEALYVVVVSIRRAVKLVGVCIDLLQVG